MFSVGYNEICKCKINEVLSVVKVSRAINEK
jgi:hypothetical protein